MQVVRAKMAPWLLLGWPTNGSPGTESRSLVLIFGKAAWLEALPAVPELRRKERWLQ
jgi:hypothetical protein